MNKKELMISKMSVSQKEMEQSIQNHADYHSHGGHIDLTTHINNWADNKEHLFMLFGEKLKIEKEVESALSKDDKMELLDNYIETISNRRSGILLRSFLRIVKNEDIFTNTLSTNMEFFGKKLNAGMKLSRIFKFLVPKAELDFYQTSFSMFLQSLKVKGTLVLSIDPVDYITMSENGGSWRSCHNIYDGEFKAGTISYLQDKTTIIAYVKSTDIEVGGLTIPKKVWRQCIYVDPNLDSFIHSRSYPNSNKSNRSTATNIIKELLEQFHGEKFDFQEGFEDTELVSMRGWIKDEPDSDYRCHYNDIREGAINRCYVVRTHEDVSPRIAIGWEVSSLCGDSDLISDSGYLTYDRQNEDCDW